MAQRKSVQDIRTNAGRPTSPGSSHRAYIRLATLEMERVRRKQEFESAQARADAAGARVEQLEREIAQLVGQIRPAGPNAAGNDHAESAGAVSTAEPRHDRIVELKHRYGPTRRAPRAPEQPISSSVAHTPEPTDTTGAAS